MGEYLSRFKILMAIFLAVVILISYFTIYLPMKNELEKSSIEKFVLMAQSNDLIIKQYINRCIDNVESLSSSYMTKNKIREYEEGIVDFQELQEYISPMYLEELGAIENIIGAIRFIDNQEIIAYGDRIDLAIIKQHNTEDVFYEIDFVGVDLLVFVYCPIKDESTVLGYDIVYFDLNPIFREMNNGDIKSFVLNPIEADARLKNKLNYIDIKDMHIIEDDNFIGYLYSIRGTNKYLYTRISKDILFSSIDEVTKLYQIGVNIIVAVFILLLIWITVRNTRKIISKSEKSILKYKEYAVKDSLTGVYSRFFFDNWLAGNIIDTEILDKLEAINYIILIDIDDFKHINDKYGHIVGDRAIRKFADILTKSVREDDLVVRYGGDEFLLLLKDTNIDTSEKILARIKDKLREADDFDFHISVSGGIEELKDINKIEECLKSADKKMYNAKRKKKVVV